MRQYRLALRMEEAFKQISLGLSLTQAAHAAGFSDSAQFCRICRRMFGSAPRASPISKSRPRTARQLESNREDRRRQKSRMVPGRDTPAANIRRSGDLVNMMLAPCFAAEDLFGADRRR
jgi:AraC-like DNA-binding protein